MASRKRTVQSAAPEVGAGVADLDALNTIKVPLTDVRMILSERMRAGETEFPLGDLLILIQEVIRKKKED